MKYGKFIVNYKSSQTQNEYKEGQTVKIIGESFDQKYYLVVYGPKQIKDTIPKNFMQASE